MSGWQDATKVIDALTPEEVMRTIYALDSDGPRIEAARERSRESVERAWRAGIADDAERARDDGSGVFRGLASCACLYLMGFCAWAVARALIGGAK